MRSPYIIVLRCFFAFFSLVSLSLLIRNIRHILKFRYVSNELLKVVYMMTISLFVFSISQFFFSLLELFDSTHVVDSIESEGTACVIMSIIENIAFSSSVLWYANIALMLFMLLWGYSVSWLKGNIWKQTLTVYTTSFFLWLGGFMPYYGRKKVDKYCWVDVKNSQKETYTMVIYYVPVLITLVLSFFVLSMALYQLRHKKTILDITAFVGCFVIVWFVPIVGTISGWLGQNYAWLDDAHDLSLSLSGIFHFQVWIFLSKATRGRRGHHSTVADSGLMQQNRNSSLIISTIFSKDGPMRHPSTTWSNQQAVAHRYNWQDVSVSEAISIKLPQSSTHSSLAQSLLTSQRTPSST